ncbi:MAG: signal peptidase I [Candidatus Aureabacteria bacterium]|nr:signal peptidase I [Candidatus Auribacterota bacterium]
MNIKRILLIFLIVVALVAVFAVLIKKEINDIKTDPIFENYKIPANSMAPTIQKGDRIIANLNYYQSFSPKRGDIVIFHARNIKKLPSKKHFIKRIVAFPGETVEIKDPHIYINNKKLTEPKIFLDHKYTGKIPEWNYGTTGKPVRVPEGHYFVLGDNSFNSNDSRHWGFVPMESVLGRGLRIYWPPSRMGVIE